MEIRGKIVTFKSDEGSYINKPIHTDEDIAVIRNKVFLMEDKAEGHINIAIPTDIAKNGLIELEKDPKMKEKLEELFWGPLIEWGKKNKYI